MRQPDEFCRLVLDLFEREAMVMRMLEQYLPHTNRSGPWMTPPTLERFEEIEKALLRQQEAWVRLQTRFRMYHGVVSRESPYEEAS